MTGDAHRLALFAALLATGERHIDCPLAVSLAAELVRIGRRERSRRAREVNSGPLMRHTLEQRAKDRARVQEIAATTGRAIDFHTEQPHDAAGFVVINEGNRQWMI